MINKYSQHPLSPVIMSQALNLSQDTEIQRTSAPLGTPPHVLGESPMAWPFEIQDPLAPCATLLAHHPWFNI